jgi:hypothetical protein
MSGGRARRTAPWSLTLTTLDMHFQLLPRRPPLLVDREHRRSWRTYEHPGETEYRLDRHSNS